MKIYFLLIAPIIILFNSCLKNPLVPSTPPTPSPVSYSVKYDVTSDVSNTKFYAYYNDIPDSGKTAISYNGFVSSHWSATFSSTGYHNAPYYVKIECLAINPPGMLHVKVYQDTVLIRSDSAAGSAKVIELSGKLPK